MNDTPTPRTDKCLTFDSIALCETLERELTAVTEQRDRLADALRKIKNAGGTHNDPYDELDFIDGITYVTLQSLDQPTKP